MARTEVADLFDVRGPNVRAIETWHVTVEYLAAHPADLLVMGSVATRVAARCQLPLLIARPRHRAAPAKGKEGATAAAPRGHDSADIPSR